MPLHSQHGHSHSHAHKTRGLILDRGWRYDLEVWFSDRFLLHGEIKALRQRVLDLADRSTGHDLLDVGCGTGTLAVEAARRWAGAGQVTGVDPGPRQVARARSKARRAGVGVDFQLAVMENLPFPDESFDTVTSTLMMHHLPADVRLQGLTEIARVLRPEGRLIIADFSYPEDHEAGSEPAGNGYGDTGSLPDLILQSGFSDARTEHVAFKRSHRGWTGISLTSAVKT